MSFLVLYACGSSSDSTTNINLSGKWTQCVAVHPPDIGYLEVIYSDRNTKYESTVYGGMDIQCINLFPDPVVIQNARLILDNPHLSDSGLTVYDYTLVDVTAWDNVSNTVNPRPNFYSILYLEGDKLYTGKLTTALDGTSEARRPNEIDFSNFLTRE